MKEEKYSKRKYLIIPAAALIIGFIFLNVLNCARLGIYSFERSTSYLLDRSRHIKERARPQYQRDVIASLSPNSLNGKYYRLDDHFDKARVATNHPSKCDDRSGLLLAFGYDQLSGLKLVPALGKSSLQVKGSIGIIHHKSPDYLTNEKSIEIPVEQLGEIIIRARVMKDTTMTVAWHRTSNPPPADIWDEQMSLNLFADTEFHTYSINVKSAVTKNFNENERIRRIFVGFPDADDIVVEIESIRFISVMAQYCEKSIGTDYQIINGEMRNVLYALPPEMLEYSLQCPEREPVLEFGTAILIGGEPVDFEVLITSKQGTKRLFSQMLTDASKWQDTRLSLSEWRGKEVLLTLMVRGSSKNVAFWSNPLISSKPNRRFNVIIFSEDALRADHLSYNGYSLATSPNKDRLFAEHGIVFTNAISQACWTRSSVPSLMTSLLPSATGVWNYGDSLQDEYLTLAEIMRSQGFKTASFVQTPNASPWVGTHQGFSQLFDSTTLGWTTEGILGDCLKHWLRANGDHNFFLYLHIQDPHGPYDPPEPFNRWYRDAGNHGKPLDRAYVDAKSVEKPTAQGRRLLYDGEICHNDAVLPNLLGMLRDSGISTDTLLVFLSDHGEFLGEHGIWDHHEPGFMQVIHVPLAFVYPRRYPVSQRITNTVQLIDVTPTILELADVDTSNMLFQGDSLIDLVEGRRAKDWPNRLVVSEEPREMVSTAKQPRLTGSLLFRNMHLISSRNLFKGSWRLPAFMRLLVFDYHNDPAESIPILSFLPDIYLRYRFAKVLTELQANDIDAWRRWSDEKNRRVHKLDPAEQKNLKTLGYIK
jgi:hypothetical protein